MTYDHILLYTDFEDKVPVRNIPLNPKKSFSRVTYDVILLEVGERRAQISFYLHQATSLPFDTLHEGMKNLPFRILTAITLEHARAVQSLVLQNGGVCVVTKTQHSEYD